MRNDDDRTTGVERAPPASPRLDPAKYRSELEGFDLTEAQAQDLLATLWSIMRSFVELGFAVDVCAAVFDEPPVPNDAELH